MLSALAFIPIRVWLIGACAVAALTAGGVFIHHVKQQAAEEAVQRIEQQDRKDIDAASQARSVRRACVDGGGVWDTASGKCQGR